MAEQRLVPAIAIALGLVFLTLFVIVSGPLASSPAETGPLHALSHFFTPGMQADPAQYLTAEVVRVAVGFLALTWLALPAVPLGSADATIRAALRPVAHWRRAMLAFLLGAHVLGLGALQLFISYGGTPKWIFEAYTLGLPGFFLSLLPEALGLLVCGRLLFGRSRAAYDYYLGAFAALGAAMALIAHARELVKGLGSLHPADFTLSLIAQVAFSGLAIWPGILLVRSALPQPGIISSKALVAYTVAGGIVFARCLGHVLNTANVFRVAPSIAWMDLTVGILFLAFAAACLSHAAALAMIKPGQALPAPLPPPETAIAPAPASPTVTPENAGVVPTHDRLSTPPTPQSRRPLLWVIDSLLGFFCSGLLAVLAMYALTKVLPMGVLVYFPITPLMSAGGFIVLLAGILSRRPGYVLGAAVFEGAFWLLLAR